MVSISDLPQELVDKIVGEVKDDEDSLRTCALISPAFVPSTRQHLFASVRLLGHNLHPFQALIDSSPFVASHVRRLTISVISSQSGILFAPGTLAQLPNLTHLYTHDDPFGFRHLSPTQESVLADAARRLTTVELLLHQLWTVPAWASLLNGCASLGTLIVSANATGWGTWSAADVDALSPSTTPGVLRLRTLHVSGDCKILAPLGAWLVPQGALAALHTLVLDVSFMADDYLGDRRVPLLQAAASSLRELKLNLDPHPPSSITFASFPNLRTLHLYDGYDAELNASLDWMVAFFSNSNSHSISSHESAIEHLFLDHATTRERLLAIPAPTWAALEDALLGPFGVSAVHSHFRTLTLSGYADSAVVLHDAYAHFSQMVRERLPRLVERGMLAVD
ncbi:hypothetical protein C8R45DRAFT_1212621 [Mycena sanguinolenta]|nr:hypothetical protein C8R45DRAFT_1212621 [Mycena sanguinolenta]